MLARLSLAALLGLTLLAPAEAQDRWRPPDPYPRYPGRTRDPYPRQEDRYVPRDGREVWRYNSFEWGGTFERTRGDLWIQNRINMNPAYFREVARTPEYVELYDDSRGMAVRLHADAMYYNPDGRQWRGPHAGYWESGGRFRR